LTGITVLFAITPIKRVILSSTGDGMLESGMGNLFEHAAVNYLQKMHGK
jgi:hypothetical protein